MAGALTRRGGWGRASSVAPGLALCVILNAGCSPEDRSEFRLDPTTTGIEFAAASHTLVLVVQQECPACAASMPFYRRITDRVDGDVQVVVAAPARNVGIRDYLGAHGVEPDSIVLLGPEGNGALPVSMTPTLLLTDSSGRVLHAWVGKLSGETEEDLLVGLFGRTSRGGPGFEAEGAMSVASLPSWRSAGRETAGGQGRPLQSGRRKSSRRWAAAGRPARDCLVEGNGSPMTGMWWDVRHAVRGLRRAPVMTAGVILMLAVGVGANVAAFRAAYGLLVKALPYADAGRLVRVGRVRSGQDGVGELSRRAFVALRNEGRSFTGVAGYAPRTLAWVAPEGPVLLRGATASPALFRLLGATIHAGRLFTEAEATAGRHRVVLLSYGTWTRRFSADPAVIGSGVMLGNGTYTVVGVLAQDVAFPSPEVEFWVPMVLWSPEADLNRVRVTFPVVGRLKPGMAIEQARAELGAIAGRSGVGRSSGFEERVVPLREEMTARYRPALWVLLVAAGLLFLVVGVNVTGLLLGSLLARRHQFAMLGVLGASPTRIVRTLLFEAILLGVAGGAVGLAAAAVGFRVVSSLIPVAVRPLVVGTGDWMVVGFGAILSVGVGATVGVVLAMHSSGVGLGPRLYGSGSQAARGFRFLSGNGVRSFVVTVQVGLALVLLMGAGALMESFAGLVAIDPGYDGENVLSASVSSPDLPSRYFDGISSEEMGSRFGEKRRFYRALTERIQALENLAEVMAVGLSSSIPFNRGSSGIPVPLRVESGVTTLPQALLTEASPGFFEALRPRLRAGRAFTDRDRAGSVTVAIVNETLARALEEPAVGRRVTIHPDSPRPHVVEVVGVVADTVVPGRIAGDTRPEIYISMLQPSMFSEPDEMFVTIRTIGEPTAIVPFVRAAVAAAHPRAAPDNMVAMSARLSATVAEPRAYAVGGGLLAALALTLAMCGLYCVLNNGVAQRQREFGVRLALGAQRRDILELVLKEGGAVLGSGVIMGLSAARPQRECWRAFFSGSARWTHGGLRWLSESFSRSVRWHATFPLIGRRGVIR